MIHLFYILSTDRSSSSSSSSSSLADAAPGASRCCCQRPPRFLTPWPTSCRPRPSRKTSCISLTRSSAASEQQRIACGSERLSGHPTSPPSTPSSFTSSIAPLPDKPTRSGVQPSVDRWREAQLQLRDSPRLPSFPAEHDGTNSSRAGEAVKPAPPPSSCLLHSQSSRPTCAPDV